MLVARAIFVAIQHQAYFAQPLSILNIRDGGFAWLYALIVPVIWLLVLHFLNKSLRNMLALFSVGFLAIYIALTSLKHVALPQQNNLPALQLHSLSHNKIIQLDQYSQKPTVINLWASWCPPCHREMLVLAAAQQQFPAIEFVFINQGESSQQVEHYLARENLNLKQIMLDPQAQAGAAFGYQGLPTTFFVNQHGQIVSTHVGELSHASLLHQLTPLLLPSKDLP
ncbi:TlpA family protein disulfide reductase [Alkanindiges sp. WGS2144]|uniref:TlpA family protein disulfide reductase n=1 Tax=Alkanindiges sp. WGS2144 TaxID=3366808 RepID=UPI00374FE48F